MTQVNIHVSPSSLARTWECTGFPFLAAGLPKEAPTKWTAQGIDAHSVVLGAVDRRDADEVYNIADSTDADLPTAQKWRGHAAVLIELASKARAILVEVKLDELQELGMVPDPERGDEQHRCDMIWFDGTRWNFCDYKSGKTPVSVTRNKQLLSYAWAWMKKKGLLTAGNDIVLWIYQPEVSSEPMSWTCSIDHLIEFGRETASKILQAEEGGQLKTGEWCTWCKVAKAGACPKIINERAERKAVVDEHKAEGAHLGRSMTTNAAPAQEASPASLIPLPVPALPAEVASAITELVKLEAEILAVDQGNAEVSAALLKRITVIETKAEDARLQAKAPYTEGGKAVDAFFKQALGPLGLSKASLKNKFDSHAAIEQRKRDVELKRQKDEQDRIAKELKEKEDAAAKLKGAAAKAKAAAEIQELQQKAVEASVSTPLPPPKKIAGVSSVTVYSFSIPDITKIPERYLIKSAKEVEIPETGETLLALVQLDVKVLRLDAAAGRLDKVTWLKVTKTSKTRAS